MSEYAVETSHLTKKYGTQTSVSDVSLHIRRGRIYGLLGRNGAGKTTLMKMLVNLIQPSSGEIEVFGMPIRQKEKEILPQIGCLIESPGFYPNLTGYENLKIFATLRGSAGGMRSRTRWNRSGWRKKKRNCFPSIPLA